MFEISPLVFDDAHIDIGKDTAIARQQVGKIIARHHLRHADIEITRHAFGPHGDRALRVRHCREDAPRMQQ